MYYLDGVYTARFRMEMFLIQRKFTVVKNV